MLKYDIAGLSEEEKKLVAYVRQGNEVELLVDGVSGAKLVPLTEKEIAHFEEELRNMPGL